MGLDDVEPGTPELEDDEDDAGRPEPEDGVDDAELEDDGDDVLEEDVNILPKNPEILFLRVIAGEHTLWVSR